MTENIVYISFSHNNLLLRINEKTFSTENLKTNFLGIGNFQFHYLVDFSKILKKIKNNKDTNE